MSISYYAIPMRDALRVGPILEGSDTSVTIDTAKVRDALRRVLSREDGGVLKWESGRDYISVHLKDTHALVTHNPGRGSAQVEVLIEILDALRRAGLHVYDPQQGSWFHS